MSIARLITILAVLVLNFSAAIFLQTKLQAYSNLELAFIILGIIVGIVVLASIGASARWAWPVTTLFFSASMANLLFLFLATDAIVTFLGATLVNLVGMMIAVLSITREVPIENPAPVETYDVREPKQAKTQRRAGRRGSRRR